MKVLEVPLNSLLFILNEVVDDIYVTNNIRPWRFGNVESNSL